MIPASILPRSKLFARHAGGIPSRIHHPNSLKATGPACTRPQRAFFSQPVAARLRTQPTAGAGTGPTVAAAAALLATSASSFRDPPPPALSETERPPPLIGARLLFLGTGSSTGCPRPICSVLPPDAPLARSKACAVSRLATAAGVDPRHNRNYRGNPSLLIQHGAGATGRRRSVLVDCGKTFREHALRHLPEIGGVSSIDAVLLTHGHADAIGGLDDLRGFQLPREREGGISSLRPVDVFLSEECRRVVGRQFPYLMPERDVGSGVQRKVANLNFNVLRGLEEVRVADMRTVPLEVMHGEDMVCLGFHFSFDREREAGDDVDGRAGANVLYLSDISRMLPHTLEYIQNIAGGVDVMVVDTLSWKQRHPTHFCLEEAMELIRAVKPKAAYLVGMNCDAFPPHEEMNEILATDEKYQDVNVRFAHDGLVVDL